MLILRRVSPRGWLRARSTCPVQPHHSIMHLQGPTAERGVDARHHQTSRHCLLLHHVSSIGPFLVFDPYSLLWISHLHPSSALHSLNIRPAHNGDFDRRLPTSGDTLSTQACHKLPVDINAELLRLCRRESAFQDISRVY